MLDELIKAAQIDIGEELAVQVPDGEPLVLWCAKQGLVRRYLLEDFRIAPEPVVLRAVVIYQDTGEPEGILIPGTAGDQGEERRKMPE